MKLALLAAGISGASALSVDWAKAFALLPASAFNNATTTSDAPRLGAVSYCSKAGSLAKNFVGTITPDAAHANDVVTTIFDYDLDAVITGGTAKYSVTYNFIPISPTVDDLCADQAGSPDPCPLGVGHHTDKSVTTFPDLTGSVTSTIEWADSSGNPILCLKWAVKA